MTKLNLETDTIAAIATPKGKGGIGIIRLSGPGSLDIAKQITHQNFKPRVASFCKFYAAKKQCIDEGIVLYFPNPHSFTGEDVIEFQGHGGPVVLDYLLDELLKLGARLATAGEFSQRAFLNGKLDLAQAEAIADLIDSGSRQAAVAAINSLQGKFSKKVDELITALIHLRMYVEAAIDFPEEEIDFLSDTKLTREITSVLNKVDVVMKTAGQGRLLQEGMNVVIAGKPNAGKSSLLNQLVGHDSAIVTDIPGTTRDILKEYIQIDGMPLHIIDTAGLRDTKDIIEQEGVNRAKQAIEKADHLLLVIDANEYDKQIAYNNVPHHLKKTIVLNKVDLTKEKPTIDSNDEQTTIKLSAKTGAGIDLLKQHLKAMMGYDESIGGQFTARRRHLSALDKAKNHVAEGFSQLKQHKAGELLAEDLRLAQKALEEITGAYSADDLLGEIFSSFCIGK